MAPLALPELGRRLPHRRFPPRRTRPQRPGGVSARSGSWPLSASSRALPENYGLPEGHVPTDAEIQQLVGRIRPIGVSSEWADVIQAFGGAKPSDYTRSWGLES